MAPFEHLDMVGLDLGIAVESYLWPHLEDSHEVFPMLTDKVAKGELGFKTGGVGFRTWTPEEQKAFRENLLDHLARQVRGRAGRGCCGEAKRLSAWFRGLASVRPAPSRYPSALVPRLHVSNTERYTLRNDNPRPAGRAIKESSMRHRLSRMSFAAHRRRDAAGSPRHRPGGLRIPGGG